MTKSSIDEQEAGLRGEIDALVARAAEAQQRVAAFDDATLDRALRAVVGTFVGHAGDWARRELDATRIGNSRDKTHKLNLVLTRVFDGLHGTRTIGRIGESQGLIEYASPMGVIFAVVPLTNPVPNSLFKSLLCIKTRNALIASFPRAAQDVGREAIETIRAAIEREGLPADLIQHCPSPSREKTDLLMRHTNVAMILATGGESLVHAAYSSGTPAFGVGPGNVAVLVSATADPVHAAREIIRGKIYDNGIVCGSESNVVVARAIRDDFVAALKASGARVLREEEREAFIEAIVNDTHCGIKRDLIGLDAEQVATIAGMKHDATIGVFVVPMETNERSFLTKEKMIPILTLFTSEDGEGVEDAAMLLESEGAGHTAVIHSRDPIEIDAFATRMPAGRILVNTSATHGMLGESSNLPVSFMQGSGSWGRNGSTDPIAWRHLVNIKRLAYGHA